MPEDTHHDDDRDRVRALDETELAGELVVDTAQGPITVRAHSFNDGLRLMQRLRPLIDGLLDSAPAEPGHVTAFDHWKWMEAIGERFDDFMALLEAATGKTRAELDALSDDDGLAVMEAYWAVNRTFFVRRVLMVMGHRARASRSSTPSSSPAGTRAPTSPATPSGSSASTTART